MTCRKHASVTEGALAICFIAAGLNLRPSLASIGPVAQDIQHSLSMGYDETGLLIALPTLCMGMFSLVVSCFHFQRPIRPCVWAIAGIGIATAARQFTSNASFLLVTALLCGTGIAVAQALLPNVVKGQGEPAAATRRMARFSASIMAGAGISAASAPWIATMANWHLALSVWCVLAFPSMWLLKRLPDSTPKIASPMHGRPRRWPTGRTPWILGIYFGLSSGLYAAMLAWLPALYVDIGWRSDASGQLMAYFIFAEVVGGLYIPRIHISLDDRRAACWVSLALVAIGLVGMLLYRDAYPLLWVGVLGLGIGALFPLTLLLPLDAAGDADNAQCVVPFVQGVGYIIAAIAPYLLGLLRQAASGFGAGLTVLLAITFGMAALTVLFEPGRLKRGT